ncbi:MAG: hypothetical protein SOT71_13835, partial [Romboutsia timonensis]|uniref:hypothetical protein n=1 Tax=Romboutsia timonensis TaxID=1776391 RepID=UPI002A75A9E7
SIFIVPNSINVEQIKVEYEVPGAWGDIPVLPELEKGNVIVMTWDKFIQIDEEIIKDYIVVLDEVHQTLIDMFRIKKINKLYENLAAAKGQMDITATPNKLNFNDYSYILEYKQEVQTNYNVKLYDRINDDEISSIIRNSNKFALLKDDTNYLNFIKENNPDKKIDVITSSTRNLSKTYKEIVTKGTMANVQGICNTSVLIAGLNIDESNITDIIIVGVKDIATIKQYVARFRDLKEVNVHIFNNYKEEESKTYDIEWLVDTRLQEVKIDIDYFNKKNKNENFVEQLLELSPIKLDSSQDYYWNKESYKYIVNEIGIRNTCYTKYYTRADIGSFKTLLGEYFNNIDIVEIKETDNIARKVYNQITTEEKKQILQQLEKEKNILVGAVEIISNKITTKTENYINNNGFSIEDLKKELEKKNIDEYIQISNIAKIINLYTKYVIDNKYNYNLAWCVANKGNRSRGKFFNQLNNIIYREIEKKYPHLMRYVKIEDKLYNFIVKMFTPGISYTEEHLKEFCEAVAITIPGVKLTTNKLGELLAQIYNIKQIRTKDLSKLQGIDFIFNKNNNSIGCNNKQVKINTVESFLTLEDIINQNKLDDISLKVLNNLLGERIKQIEKEAIEINNINELFVV